MDKGLPRPDAGEVRHPRHVRRRRPELPLYLIRGKQSGRARRVVGRAREEGRHDGGNACMAEEERVPVRRRGPHRQRRRGPTPARTALPDDRLAHALGGLAGEDAHDRVGRGAVLTAGRSGGARAGRGHRHCRAPRRKPTPPERRSARRAPSAGTPPQAAPSPEHGG